MQRRLPAAAVRSGVCRGELELRSMRGDRADHDPVTAGLFRPVQTHVGQLDELLETLTAGRVGDAEARSEGGMTELGVGERGSYALQDAHRPLRVELGHGDDELFASPAGDQIDVPEHALNRLREESESPVAGFMAVLVVELLEVVEVGDRK